MLKKVCVPKLKNRTFNILYNPRNSAESNLQNAGNRISGVLDFKIFRGKHASRPP